MTESAESAGEGLQDEKSGEAANDHDVGDTERFGPGWFVIERFHQDPARVVSGPKDRDAAESHAHFLTDPNARIMHTPALVNAIQNDGYNVEWSEQADKPAALKGGGSA